MRNYKVGVIGATGMVGQRFLLLLENHPWFTVTQLAASPRSAGKTYEEAVGTHWLLERPMPEKMKNIVVKDAMADIDFITAQVDFVFCAVSMNKAETNALEEAYAKHECPVMTCNSANRMTEDVPMIIPEINPEHILLAEAQKKRLGTKRGFISAKSNCSIQSYVPALEPLRRFGITKILACTYQAISGAGKTFETWPEMIDNIIPYIPGEEEKSEKEPLKIWGKFEDGKLVSAKTPLITTQCLRVPVSNGHFAAVFASFENIPKKEEIIEIWNNYTSEAVKLALPSAPKRFIRYFEEENYPQSTLHRDLGNGMTVSVGRLREDTQYDFKFVCLSHNTLRGAAGGAVEMAELYAAKGYFD